MAIQTDLSGENPSPEEETKIITAPKRPPGVKMTIEHFMGLVEHKPHQSILQVHDQQEGFHYRLVLNNSNRIRYFNALGFEVVTDPDDANMGDTGQPDGRRLAGAGELLLMKRPEEYQAMHKLALQKKAKAMHRGPVESFKGKAERMGFEVIDEMREVVGPMDLPMRDKDV